MVCFALRCPPHRAKPHRLGRHNNDSRTHSEPPIGYLEYLTTGHFYETTFENWESESADGCLRCAHGVPRAEGWPNQKARGRTSTRTENTATTLGSVAGAPRRSLVEALPNSVHRVRVLFLLDARSCARWDREYNAEQSAHGESSDFGRGVRANERFWYQSFRTGKRVSRCRFDRRARSSLQRGSPESKPVRAPHAQTGSDRSRLGGRASRLRSTECRDDRGPCSGLPAPRCSKSKYSTLSLPW